MTRKWWQIGRKVTRECQECGRQTDVKVWREETRNCFECDEILATIRLRAGWNRSWIRYTNDANPTGK